MGISDRVLQHLPGRRASPLVVAILILLAVIATPSRANPEPGALDLSFGDGGKATADFPGGMDDAYAAAVQSDGKIVVAGSSGGSPEKNDFALARYNPDGTLDPTFGSGGFVTTHVRGWDEATAVRILSDGRILAAGCADCRTSSTDVALLRYHPDGTLDATFGVGGIVTTHVGQDRGATDLALQPDGKIVISGGTGELEVSDFLVARFNTDGSRDASFGPSGDGTATADLGGYDIAEGLVVQPDGRLVAAGCANCAAGGTRDFGVARFLPTGSPDPTFGNQGGVFSDFDPVFGSPDSASDLALQDDGKIVVAGESRSRFALLRLSESGAPDATFGRLGQVTTSFGSFTQASARAVAVQGDGRIVAAGQAGELFGDPDFALARYTSGGQLDEQFGSQGLAKGGFPQFAEAADLALLADGRMLAAGSAFHGLQADFALLQLTSGGSLDGAFGSDGRVTSDAGRGGVDSGHAVALHEDGRILVAGDANQGSGFGLARFTADGNPDTSFDDDGKTVVGFDGRLARANDVLVQPNGMMLAAGTAADYEFALARLDSAGALDPAFGIGGRAVVPFSEGHDEVHGLALQPDGKIVVAGCSHCSTASGDFAVARLNADGSLDPTFGTGGRVSVDFGGDNPDQANDIAIQPDGRIVVAGTAGVGNTDIGVIRLNPDGTLDPLFGTAGKTTVAVGPAWDTGGGVALQLDGKIVVAGSSAPLFGEFRFAVTRLASNGTLDPTFGSDGKVTTDFSASDDRANSLAIQPDGRILVVGCADCGIGSFALARYNPAGALDATFGNGGMVITKFGDRDNDAADVALQKDGKIVVGGGVADDFLAARYLSGLPTADLSVSKSDSPDPVKVKKELTYVIAVRNQGPSPASDVILTDALPVSVRFMSVSATQGSCTHADGRVSCILGGIALSDTVTVTIKVEPQAQGIVSNTASASSSTHDPSPSNNSASVITTVTKAGAR